MVKIFKCADVLVQRENGELARSVSEYSAIWASHPLTGSGPKAERRRLKLQLVSGLSRKEKHVGWSALTQPAWVEEQTG